MPYGGTRLLMQQSCRNFAPCMWIAAENGTHGLTLSRKALPASIEGPSDSIVSMGPFLNGSSLPVLSLLEAVNPSVFGLSSRNGIGPLVIAGHERVPSLRIA